jgi:hypothetical protein
MATQPAPSLLLSQEDDAVVSEWTTSPADLHFHDYAFDDYNTEIITLEADYDHRTDIKALHWEETHRQWTGETWQLDFAALDTAVEHFLDRGYSVTIAASDLSIFLSDYDAPFLEAQLPDDPPPDVEDDGDNDGQTDLNAF